MTHKHFSMSNFAILRNITSGVFTFVPEVFMASSGNIATFQGFRNENEY